MSLITFIAACLLFGYCLMRNEGEEPSIGALFAYHVAFVLVGASIGMGINP